MKIRTKDEIKERIQKAIIEEMNTVNIITQGLPEKWVPIFVKTLSLQLYDLCIDEIENRRRF